MREWNSVRDDCCCTSLRGCWCKNPGFFTYYTRDGVEHIDPEAMWLPAPKDPNRERNNENA
jgi:hypothetical protein